MSKHQFPVINLCLFLALFVSALPAHSEDSVIDSVMKANESLVTVQTLQTEFRKVTPEKNTEETRPGNIKLKPKLIQARLSKSGAGVIVDPSGIIVTNLHTIKFADKIAVTLHDGTTVGAQLLQMTAKHDLALLSITPPQELKAIKIADSDNVRLADEVINIGHSDLLKRTISGGIVSRLGTVPGKNGKTVEIIQVNMNLYKGDSGGPLLDSEGRLVGMIAAKYKSRQRAALAIPSNKIKQLYKDYLHE